MLELIARIESTGSDALSGMINNDRIQNADAAHARAVAADSSCPACKGAGYARKQQCPRCYGSGRRSVASANATRSRRQSELDTGAISFLLAGMPRHHYAAARLRVLGCLRARHEAMQWLLDDCIVPVSQEWSTRKEPEEIERLCVLMADLATWELPRPSERIKDVDRYTRLGLTESTWRKVWRERYAVPKATLNSWVLEADRHMRERLR